MPPGQNQVVVGGIPVPALTEHDPRVFVVNPDRYEKDMAVFKTWLDGRSYQGWRVVNTTTRFYDDGKIVILALAIKETERKVREAIPVMAIPQG